MIEVGAAALANSEAAVTGHEKMSLHKWPTNFAKSLDIIAELDSNDATGATPFKLHGTATQYSVIDTRGRTLTSIRDALTAMYPAGVPTKFRRARELVDFQICLAEILDKHLSGARRFAGRHLARTICDVMNATEGKTWDEVTCQEVFDASPDTHSPLKQWDLAAPASTLMGII